MLLLPGCRSELDALLGTWCVELDIQDVLMQRLEEECPGICDTIAIDSMPVMVELTFYADSTYQAQVNQESVYSACEGVMPALEQGIWEYWCALYSAQNISGDLEGYLQALGVTRRELMEEVMGDTLAQELILELDIREEGRFSIEDGKLRFTSSLDTEPEKESCHFYQIQGKTLTIKPGEYARQTDAEYYGKVLPLVFEK